LGDDPQGLVLQQSTTGDIEVSEGKKKKKAKGTTNSELSESAARLGHFGGLAGGPARDAALSSEEKSKIASMGGKAKAAHFKDKAQQSKRKKRES
jgi:hypothetical protein